MRCLRTNPDTGPFLLFCNRKGLCVVFIVIVLQNLIDKVIGNLGPAFCIQMNVVGEIFLVVGLIDRAVVIVQEGNAAAAAGIISPLEVVYDGSVSEITPTASSTPSISRLGKSCTWRKNNCRS